MPWSVKDVMEQRLDFVERALGGDEAISNLCKEFGISRTAGYKWLNRYLEAGTLTALADRSRRPKNSPTRTSPLIENRVRELHEIYGWGPKKTHYLLAKEGIVLPLITVRRIYKRHLLSEGRSVIGPALQRFERSCPNDLLQMDYKGQFMMDDGKWCFPLSVIDDHSRYCLGLYALPDQHGERAEKSLTKTFEKYGVPSEMLMDHGTPWWNCSNEWGLTKLSVKLIKQGIQLRFGRVRHPQTQGKVERFHRTLKQFMVLNRGKFGSLEKCQEILSEFQNIYNSIRPHESLGMNPPASRYTTSRKQFNPNPPNWEYPPGANVTVVDGLGRISYDNRRFFVCEALLGEQVSIIPLEMTALVVFRDMALRELDLDTGASRAVVFPIQEKIGPWASPGGLPPGGEM